MGRDAPPSGKTRVPRPTSCVRPIRISPCALSVDQRLQIEPAHMIGEGTDVTGRGSIHFAGSKELDLAADGQADLRLLGALDPNLSVEDRACTGVRAKPATPIRVDAPELRVNPGDQGYSSDPYGGRAVPCSTLTWIL